jgi:DNA primase catalytic subunit
MKTKNEILGDLYYNKGKQFTNFRLFHNYFDEKGDKKFSKWVHYLDADDKDIDEATHRTLLSNELVLDFDPEPNQTFEDLTKKVKKVCYDLKKKGVEYDCYFTGSRGYHVHVFIRDLFFLDKEKRRDFRINFIKFFGAEIQKNSEGTAIALEGVPHWKTGTLKMRCVW